MLFSFWVLCSMFSSFCFLCPCCRRSVSCALVVVVLFLLPLLSALCFLCPAQDTERRQQGTRNRTRTTRAQETEQRHHRAQDTERRQHRAQETEGKQPFCVLCSMLSSFCVMCSMLSSLGFLCHCCRRSVSCALVVVVLCLVPYVVTTYGIRHRATTTRAQDTEQRQHRAQETERRQKGHKKQNDDNKGLTIFLLGLRCSLTFI
jgi:Ni/Co efflux regulator RcnB